MGKFTQSVRRIVQDVKDEGAPSGMTRDEVIETNERLRSLRLRLEESYDTVKKALINLMNKYGDSKSHRNIFQRYPMLKLMIKVVTSENIHLLSMILLMNVTFRKSYAWRRSTGHSWTFLGRRNRRPCPRT